MDKPKRQGAGVRSKDDNFVYDMDIVDERVGKEDGTDLMYQEINEGEEKGFVTIVQNNKRLFVQRKDECCTKYLNLCFCSHKTLSDSSAKCSGCGLRCHFRCARFVVEEDH